jgi:hypothetical protein
MSKTVTLHYRDDGSYEVDGGGLSGEATLAMLVVGTVLVADEMGLVSEKVRKLAEAIDQELAISGESTK